MSNNNLKDISVNGTGLDFEGAADRLLSLGLTAWGLNLRLSEQNG